MTPFKQNLKLSFKPYKISSKKLCHYQETLNYLMMNKIFSLTTLTQVSMNSTSYLKVKRGPLIKLEIHSLSQRTRLRRSYQLTSMSNLKSQTQQLKAILNLKIFSKLTNHSHNQFKKNQSKLTHLYKKKKDSRNKVLKLQKSKNKI